MTCQTCGRDEGHWLGCAEAQALRRATHAYQNASNDELRESGCAYEGCTKERWSADRRVKYCEDHRDSKNRKE